MRIAVFSTKPYDRQYLEAASHDAGHELTYFEPRLDIETAPLANGHLGVCAFVNDDLSGDVLEALSAGGVQFIALRCAGFNNVDLAAAQRLGIPVARVPAYSPYAVAEHSVGLILALNRKLHRAYARVREGNFSLDGLLGFDLHGRTAGIIGTGKIGLAVANILKGFGCRLLAVDPYPNPDCAELGVNYVELDELYQSSDIITIHAPLSPATAHLINQQAIAMMKPGVMIINTSRGAIVDTTAMVAGLKSGKVGALGIDVYEEEADLFFEDLSNTVIQDDVFARLLTFPNVIVTGHQAFFTHEALTAIAITTMDNIGQFEATGTCDNVISNAAVRGG